MNQYLPLQALATSAWEGGVTCLPAEAVRAHGTPDVSPTRSSRGGLFTVNNVVFTTGPME